MKAVIVRAAALSCVLVLGACDSQRFGSGRGPVFAAPSGPTAIGGTVDPVTPAPAGSVVSQPLPPPGGATVAALPGATAPDGTPLPAPGTVDPATGATVPGQPATLPREPRPAPQLGQQAAAPPPATRTSVTGTWRAQTGGSSCRVTLSSSPALDLYRASTGGCSDPNLKGITAWDLKGGDVVLYKPGGVVAARVRAGGGAMNGSVTSGEAVTLSR
jgi:hypothetical protein